MSTPTHTTNGHVASSSSGFDVRRTSRHLEPTTERQPSRHLAHLEHTRVFAGTVGKYLVRVLPQARNETAHWRGRAAQIPARDLRDAAASAMEKVGNIEGAALFATLAPPARRSATIRALVAFQTAYNYLDALSELPSEDPVANADQLHQALLCALHPEVEEAEYYECYPGDDDDGGFLTDLVQVCRSALRQLPSFGVVAPMAREAAGRIVDFQTLNLPEHSGGHDALRSWAKEGQPAGSDLEWWETAAGGGSSLAVHALIAAAADPDLDVYGAREIGGTYYPWGGAAHSLLDSLVDREEDTGHGQRSLLDYYVMPAHAADRLAVLASRACDATGKLPGPDRHRVILTAMCSYYLSAPECYTPEAFTITNSLTRSLGMPLNVAIWMFRIKRLANTLTRSPYT